MVNLHKWVSLECYLAVHELLAAFFSQDPVNLLNWFSKNNSKAILLSLLIHVREKWRFLLDDLLRLKLANVIEFECKLFLNHIFCSGRVGQKIQKLSLWSDEF